MSRFIRRHEPKTRVSVPIRHEHATLVSTRDYETQISLALKHDRFNHACQLFNELKKAFLGLPIAHQEERRQYYRLLQMAYKEIYDYVADKHKTARILEEMQGSDNVFGTGQSTRQSAVPKISLEESMRGSAPKQQAVVPPSLPPATQQPVQEEAVAPTPAEVVEPQPVQEEEPSSSSSEGELQQAQEELERWKRSYFGNEVHIIRKSDDINERPAPPQAVADMENAEAFSSLYVRGVQALGAGDYAQAAQLFKRRLQQDPNDRAARIRLDECMEVLHASTT